MIAYGSSYEYKLLIDNTATLYRALDIRNNDIFITIFHTFILFIKGIWQVIQKCLIESRYEAFEGHKTRHLTKEKQKEIIVIPYVQFQFIMKNEVPSSTGLFHKPYQGVDGG